MEQYKLDSERFGEAIWRLRVRDFDVSKVDGKDNCLDIHCISDPEAGLLGRIIMERYYVLFQILDSDSVFGGEYLLETMKDYLC